MFSFPSKPKIIEKKGENFAIFEVAELYPGYGTTIGNSLRRVLLSSIPGASITQIKIKGIQHEFSTIPGVLEDVILIILNLKKLRFKLFSDEPQTAILKAKGEKEVKAADFKLPSQVEIVNKDAHIATLTDKKADLEIEARIEKGIGYEPVERRKKEKLPIGFIAIDAIFSPIKRVSYSVENMRVGERTDFDRLKIEIETDGSITPEEAFSYGSEILVKHFSLLTDAFKKEEKVSKEIESQKTKGESTKLSSKDIEDKGQDKVEDLKISSRIIGVLVNNNIKTLKDILKKKEDDLLSLEGMGKKGVEEIKKALKKLGLQLK